MNYFEFEGIELFVNVAYIMKSKHCSAHFIHLIANISNDSPKINKCEWYELTFP